MGTLRRSHTFARMKVVILLSLLAGAFAAPESRVLCSECVDEMHKLGHMVKMGAVVIHDYIRDNYCPTLGDHQHFCRESLSRYYVGMLYAVVEHYFVDGALHVCQTGGVCEAAKEYTCDECIQGLEWVEAYIEDPIMIAEFTIYLEQNYCLSDWDDCKQLVAEHFPNMHTMAMEKFFIPTEICMQEPVCGADPPTRPPEMELEYISMPKSIDLNVVERT